MIKKKKILLIISFFALCLITVVVYNKFFNKPSKEVLLPAINEAFEYYRTDSIKRPAASVYILEYAEEYVIYEPLPKGVTIPSTITIDNFTLMRPSRFVIASVLLNGYIAYCKIEYLEPHYMESDPSPAWQVVTVEFEPIK